MHDCPHCRKSGIGVVAKLLSNPIYPATCRICGRHSTKCAGVIKIQVALALAFLATAPNFATAEFTQLLGTATAAIIVIVGQVGPMCKRSS